MSRALSTIANGLRVAVAIAASIAAVVLVTPSAAEAVATPHWLLMSQPAPTYFHAGDGSDFYEIIAVNDGSESTTGEITVTDTLPRGLTINAEGINAYVEKAGIQDTLSEAIDGCEQATAEAVVTVTCRTSQSVPIGRAVVVNINVAVPAGAAGTLSNEATISGGGTQAAVADNTTPVTATSATVPFGASLVGEVTSEAGGIDTQAASHPFAFTTLLAFNVGAVSTKEHNCGASALPSCADLNAEAKDLEVSLPPGMVGNPTAVPQCTQAQFHEQGFDQCPKSTQVGSMYLYFYGEGTHVQYAPVYNIEPPPGQPAELGFTVSTLAHIPMFFHVRSGGDYGLTADLSDINQFDPVRVAALSIWGVPAEAAHNPLRLSAYEGYEPEDCGTGDGGCASAVAPRPFLTMPSSCAGEPLAMGLAGDSWEEPQAAPLSSLTKADIAGMTGCEGLSLTPALAVEPSTSDAGSPAGYEVDLEVPQHEEAGELATPDVRDVEVTLPPGTVVSPSAANGLLACDEAQFDLASDAKGSCPQQSKIGDVRISSPLLSIPLTGSLYVGQPECSPCSAAQAQEGKLVHLLLEVEGSGVIVKLGGHTKIDEVTGQLTTVFAEDPQLPFSDLELSLEPGPNAPLANPSGCGAVVASAAITPWSSSHALDITAPAVTIDGCSASGFGPSLEAGDTTSARAGAFSAFAVTLTRPDGQQDLRSVSVTMPPGLLGAIANVPLCGEAAANAGTCAASSQIGTSLQTLGPGTEPLTIAGGKVFLTGPYAGKPFGLSIVVPAEAGPFKLGGTTGLGTVVVRASIAIDPRTSALTIATAELPSQLDGIPLDIRTVTIDVDREAFMFNPTNCDTMSIAGTIASTSGATTSASYPYQAVNCASLPFKPTFAVSTQGKASVRDNGASLTVKVTQKAGEADIKSVRVELPKKLPSRATTLRKACLEAVFVADPASCPPGSVVGEAIAHTPVLPVALSGPVYFVSHGGAKFPELVTVLQGYGVTIDLFGETHIASKTGITTSNFGSLPDTPISSFELKLPERSNSALVSTAGGLCGRKLTMPTTIVGQNGARIQQTTKIAVTGCVKRKQSRPSRPRPRR